jgi:fibronectin-binding autotransporter adhesin
MRLFLLFVTVFGIFSGAAAQTSWKGTTSTSWSNAANWTNGVPTSAKDAIIGDAGFTGNNQPKITSTAACRSLTIGGGAKASTLTLSKNLAVSGAIVVNTNGAISHGNSTISLTGNLTFSGTYTPTSNSANFTFAGSAQTIGGTGTSAFQKLTVNQNAVVTLARNMTVNGVFGVSGAVNPAESPAYKITFGTSATFNLNATGTLKVTGTLFTDNYSGKTPAIYAGSTVEYAAATAAQTVSNAFAYSTLRVSGTGTRTLAGNLTMATNTTAVGNIYVTGGTLDLLAYTASRATAGGTLSLANGTRLRIGGSANFPSNYSTTSLNLTSTVEYYAGYAAAIPTQTVATQTYGNLLLTANTLGAAVKVMPSAAFTIAGNLTSSLGTGTSLTYTAASNITVGGATTIGSGTTFNGSAAASATTYTHKLGGSLANAGTITGNNSIVNLNGSGSVVSGTGTYAFNNLTVTASNVTASATAITVTGNLSTSGSGMFRHNAGGTLTMTGAAKTITGTNLVLASLAVPGTVTTVGLTITENLVVAGSLTCTTGTIIMSGASKTISGAGTIALNTLSATGTITASSSFSLTGTLDITGSFTATTGTATFKSASLINGTANLFNVAIDGTSLQLAANTVLGIAGAFTITTGTFNTATTVPNSVIYNGTGQTVRNTTYHHLTLSNGGTKTAAGSITVNGEFTLVTGTTFDAAPSTSYTHTVKGNWTNRGTFTAGNSVVALTGTEDVTITGATTFKELTINKTNATNTVTLANNISTPLVNMTKGSLRTGANKITITGTRTGTAAFTGTIERVHAFANNISYAFESADNTIAFTTPSSITSVTVTVDDAGVTGFPFGSAINRTYTVSVPSGTYASAAVRLHYEDAALNGNSESGMTLWKYGSGAWSDAGKTSSNATANYVEKTGLTSIATSWTLANTENVVTWNGSVSSDWFTIGNWTNTQGTPSLPPTANEIVQIGTSAFINQPVINGTATAKSILFGSAQAATLTVAGGSLETQGNISGSWGGNAAHQVIVGANTLTVNGSLVLGDGVNGHSISLALGSGSMTIGGSLTQAGDASVTISGGTLFIGGDFIHTSGVFTAGTGTVTYNGTGAQAVGAVTYNQLTINKASGIATAGVGNTIAANLSIEGGEFDFYNATTITGNVTIAAGTIARNSTTVAVGGNWINNGTYVPEGGSVTFNGTGAQSISANTFNNLIINKASGTATLTGNIVINYAVTVLAGTLDLSTYTLNRSSVGGTFTLAGSASLLVGGANFPASYVTYTFGAGSTTVYEGAGAQSVSGITYGNLSLRGGNTKTLAAAIAVAGNIDIASGVILSSGDFTIDLSGNWSNSGTFDAGTGAVLLNGAANTVTGATTFNKLTVYGNYTVAGASLGFTGSLRVLTGASFNAGSGAMNLYGDLLNSGTLTSSGITTFKGTTVQNISLINAITSNSTGVINFEGSIAPILNSTSEPTFATVNITNTAGISPSVNWTIYTAMTIGSGSAFRGGGYTHTVYGGFTNNGTVISDGILSFLPVSPTVVALGANTLSSTGTMLFGGSAALSITGTSNGLSNVIVSNTAGATAAGNWSVSNTFTIEENGIFNAGSNTYTIAGNVESNGTLNGGTSTFNLTGVVAQVSGTTATTFYDLIVSGTTGIADAGENPALTINSEFNISHNLTNNYVIDASAAGIHFTGSTPSTITGSAASFALEQFTVNKSGSASTVLAKNLSGVNTVTVKAGTLDLGTATLTQDATADAANLLSVEGGAVLRIGGSNSLPTFTGYEIDSVSTIEFYGGSGTTQSIPAAVGGVAVVYGNLLLSTGGTKSAAAALTIAKNLTITAGTFSGGGFTHSVGGNWLMTAGTLSNAPVLFNGTGTQDIGSTGSFSTVTVSNSTGILTLSSGITIATNLVFSTGRIALNNNHLVMGSGAAITTPSASSYIVTNGTGELKQQAVAGAVAKMFPVGTTTTYFPASLSLTAASTTDFIGVRVVGQAYVTGGSGVVKTSGAVAATWDLSEGTAGGTNATLTLQWPQSSELTGFLRTTARIGHYVNDMWDFGTEATLGGTNPYSLTRAAGITSFSPFSVRMNETVLPLTWLTLSGKHIAPDNEVRWTTANEENNVRFEVQASRNGTDFTTIGQVAAGTGSYAFVDRQVTAPVTYYRIRQVDADGRFSYSAVIEIRGMATGTTVSPNPVVDVAIVKLTRPTAGTVVLRLADAGGHTVARNSIAVNAGLVTVPIDMGGFARGVYFLFVGDGSSEEVIRIVKK